MLEDWPRLFRFSGQIESDISGLYQIFVQVHQVLQYTLGGDRRCVLRIQRGLGVRGRNADGVSVPVWTALLGHAFYAECHNMLGLLFEDIDLASIGLATCASKSTKWTRSP